MRLVPSGMGAGVAGSSDARPSRHGGSSLRDARARAGACLDTAASGRHERDAAAGPGGCHAGRGHASRGERRAYAGGPHAADGQLRPDAAAQLFPTPEDALMDPRMARSWSAPPPRWFVATTVDVGFIYGRPRVSLGYGKPFTKWAGFDFNPVFNSGGVGIYAGGRIEIPYVDLRIGSRYWWLFTSWFLPEQDQYTRLDIARQLGNKAKVLTHEAEADISVPAGPGNILARASISYVADVPDGKAVFEPQLRVMVQKGLVWRARGGYAFRSASTRSTRSASSPTSSNVPTRDNSKTVRVGPIIRFVLSRRVDIRGSFVTTVKSPDKIGLVGGDFTELGVRYRWASEPTPGR